MLSLSRHRARAAALGLATAAAVSFAPGAARADVEQCLRDAERAQPLRSKGQLLLARGALIACSSSSCPVKVRNDCERWLDEVEAAIPSVVVRGRSHDGSDVGTARVTLDGVRVVAEAGLPTAVDPGTHRVVVDAPGFAPASKDFVIGPGERSRLLVLVLERTPGSGPAPPAATSPSSPSLLRPVPIAFFATGLALAGAGVALWVAGSSARSDLVDTCAPTSTCSHDAVVDARTPMIVGDVAVGAAIVAVALGLYFGLTAPAPARTSRGSAFAF